MGKRSRDEDTVIVLATQLEAAADDISQSVNGDHKRILQAMTAVEASIDPSDEHYQSQTSLATSNVASVLSKLLDAKSETVSIAAARTLRLIFQHSPAVMDRLAVGGNFTMGSPENVNFNPVQSDIEPATITSLVRLQFEGSSEQQSEAFSTLGALNVYNRGNKLVHLRELILRIIDGQTQAYSLAEAMIDGMELKDDVTVVVDQALTPLLKVLVDGTSEEQRPAVSLLGVIIAKRPTISEFLVAEGALRAAAALLASGDPMTSDTAVSAVWGLVKDNLKLLRPESEALGLPAASLVAPLTDIMKRSEVDSPETEGHDGLRGRDSIEGLVTGADNGETAAALFKALAQADPSIRKTIQADSASNTDAAAADKPARCSIM